MLRLTTWTPQGPIEGTHEGDFTVSELQQLRFGGMANAMLECLDPACLVKCYDEHPECECKGKGLIPPYEDVLRGRMTIGAYQGATCTHIFAVFDLEESQLPTLTDYETSLGRSWDQ